MHSVTQEFGTCSPLRVLHALREENRWHHYGSGSIAHPAKQRLRRVFAPEEGQWRETVVRRGVSFANAVLAYLCRVAGSAKAE